MQYMLLICDVETEQLAPGQPGFDELMAGYAKFSEMLQTRGHAVASHRLQPTTTATTIRVRDGKTIATDGPFAETKEQFGGYYLVDCKDLDEAMVLAAQIPTALNGSIEIRPVF
jgi:hypothetical protein